MQLQRTLIPALLFLLLGARTNAQSGQDIQAMVRIDDMLFERSRLHEVDGQSERKPNAAAGFRLDTYSTIPWTGGIMPVRFHASTSPDLQDRFFAACREWAPAGVTCVPDAGQKQYAMVTSEHAGCFAGVGMSRTAGGEHSGFINLQSPNCLDSRTMVHEIGHALGLSHEHQRADRDDYVRIDWSNVRPGNETSLERIAHARPLGPYDFASVMHYHAMVFSADTTRPTIIALPAYEQHTKTMGLSTKPTAADLAAVEFIYHSGLFATVTFDTHEVSRAMFRLDALYMTELKRPNGLSLNGEPDFSGVSTWIFNVYLTGRAGGLSEADAFYNVQALISQSDEWRARNPGRPALAPKPVSSPLRLDQGEFMETMYLLSDLYRTELKRPEGLAINGKPDFSGLSTWVVHVYLNRRMSGASRTDAWQEVVALIRDSDEWREKNPGQ